MTLLFSMYLLASISGANNSRQPKANIDTKCCICECICQSTVIFFEEYEWNVKDLYCILRSFDRLHCNSDTIVKTKKNQSMNKRPFVIIGFVWIATKGCQKLELLWSATSAAWIRLKWHDLVAFSHVTGALPIPSGNATCNAIERNNLLKH